MYKGEGVPFEPEGIMSTLTSIVQVIFGYLVGEYIVTKGKSFEMVANLFVAAALLLFTALFWDMSFPINKKIWTSSYVLYTTGLAMMILAVMIYLIELHNHRSAWTRFFDVFGKNPMFIYVLAGIWFKLYGLARIPNGLKDGVETFTNAHGWLFQQIFQPILGNYGGTLAFAIAHILVFWGIGRVMDKKGRYVRDLRLEFRH
jgi:predicted acyltransferase